MATAPARQSATGTIEISKTTLAQPYIGVTPLAAGSGNVANAPAVAILTPLPGNCAYLCGIMLTGTGATAALPVTVQVTGTLTGNKFLFTYCFAAGPTVANEPLMVSFNPPLPGIALDTQIGVTCPASGAGGTNNTLLIYGYSSTKAPDPI